MEFSRETHRLGNTHVIWHNYITTAAYVTFNGIPLHHALAHDDTTFRARARASRILLDIYYSVRVTDIGYIISVPPPLTPRT